MTRTDNADDGNPYTGMVSLHACIDFVCFLHKRRLHSSFLFVQFSLKIEYDDVFILTQMTMSDTQKEKFMYRCLTVFDDILVYGGQLFVKEYMFIFDLLQALWQENATNINHIYLVMNQIVYGAESIVDHNTEHQIKEQFSRFPKCKNVLVLEILCNMLDDTPQLSATPCHKLIDIIRSIVA